MARYRIRDKIDAQLAGTAAAFVLAFVLVAIDSLTPIPFAPRSMTLIVLVSLVVGFLCRWGWELRRWYRKTRPSYDPLASLRPKQ